MAVSLDGAMVPMKDGKRGESARTPRLMTPTGDTSAKTNAQFEKLRLVLRDDDAGVERVIRSLAHLRNEHPGRKKIARELRYFRSNRHRMRYARVKAQNLPIGSGVVEAACKTLATQRLKRVGHEARRAGGQAILTLREERPSALPTPSA